MIVWRAMVRPWLSGCFLAAALGGCNDHRYGFFGNEEGSGGEATTTGPEPTTVSPTTVATITMPDPTMPDPSTSTSTTADPSGPGTITTSPTSATVTTVTTDTTGTPGQCGEEPLASDVPQSVTRDNSGLPDAFVHSCVGSGGSDVVFVWTAPFDGVFQFDTVESGIDTVLSVFEGYCGGVELGCDDDTLQLWSEVTAELKFGTTVTIAVDGLGGQVGPIRLNIAAVDEPPPPPPPTCAPIGIGSELGEFVLSTVGGTSVLDSGCGGAGAPEVALVWTPPIAGVFRLETTGSTFDPVLSVRRGACDGPEVTCNDDTVGLEARIELFADPADGPLLVVVDGIGGQSGDVVLAITEG